MPKKRKPGKKQKKQNHFWKIFAAVVALMTAFSVIKYFVQIDRNKIARFAHYKDFGIDLPENFFIHGIDVSSHQGKINWPMVKSMQSQNVRIGFVFIKATEGLQSVDKSFAYNWAKAMQAGITQGAYHFFIPGKDGAQQAVNFIRTVPLTTGNLPPVVDIEQLYGATPALMRQELQQYLATIRNHYKVQPVIYTYASFYTQYLAGYFEDYPLWVAHYFEEKNPRVRRHWDFWQHSENGHVYGINSKVDFNVFSGDSTDFTQLLLP